MRRVLVLGGVALAIGLWSTGAAAKPGDAGWAKCVWTSAPASAEAWLGMKMPTAQTPFTDPASLLGHKLIALCEAGAADPLKPNRTPKWDSLAAALRSAKSGAAAPASAPGVTVAFCESSTQGGEQPGIFLHEVVRRQGERETVSFRQYYIEHEGKLVKLPQDLRKVVGDGTPVQRSCRTIGAQGELADA